MKTVVVYLQSMAREPYEPYEPDEEFAEPDESYEPYVPYEHYEHLARRRFPMQCASSPTAVAVGEGVDDDSVLVPALAIGATVVAVFVFAISRRVWETATTMCCCCRS